MRDAQDLPLNGLLPAPRRTERESGSHAGNRRAAYGGCIGWFAPDALVSSAIGIPAYQPGARKAFDAPHGCGSGLSAQENHDTRWAFGNLSLPPQRCRNKPGEPGLVCGHHLHPNGERICTVHFLSLRCRSSVSPTLQVGCLPLVGSGDQKILIYHFGSMPEAL